VLKIRLQRVGKRKQPSYRIVVVEARTPRSGASVEIIGHYNPLTDPPAIVVDSEKAAKWLKSGAQPSEAAAKILARQGISKEPSEQTTE
jgi:small subunit ribosomal protein S16